MSELNKTLIFVGVAVAAVLIAWLTGPAAPSAVENDLRGKLLVADFDLAKVGQVEVVEFDQYSGAADPFKVVKTTLKGKPVWTIPSHENYPTDASNQLSDVAAVFSQIQVLDVPSKDPGDHAQYGVLDPAAKERKRGEAGVGTKLTMKDGGGKDLLAVIIGKAVPDRAGLRYVRRAGDDQVCIVKADTDKVTARFDKWIEKDLLKLSTWDIKQVDVRDYSINESRRLIPRGQTLFEYNDTGDPKWKTLRDEEYTGRKWTPVAMAEDEELNVAKLDEMKNAFSDLKIVNVLRKPTGLTADLKAPADFDNHQELLQTLVLCGFLPSLSADKKEVEILASEGEVRVAMKDGVEYLLRFGRSTGERSESDKKEGEKKEGDAKKEEADKPAGMNRFLLVMAQFNEGLIARPQLESEPTDEKPADKPAADKPADDKQPDEKKADDKQPDEKKADEKNADEKKADDPQPEAKKPEGDAAAKGEAKAGEKADEDAGEKKDPEQAAKDKAAEVERIRKENQQKLDKYEADKKKGRERAEELNNRFADWYYVISDDVYRKLHINRSDFVKKKEKKEEKPEGEGEHGHDRTPAKPAAVEPLEQFDAMRHNGIGG